jgi:hypothetical protein
MLSGVIQETGKTAKGTPKLKLNGLWVYAGNLPVEGLVVGRTINYWTRDFKAGDKTLQALEAWEPAKDAPLVPLGSGPIAANTPVRSASEAIPEAEMRFISNIVAVAITAGAIKAPSDIRQWVLSARAALKPIDDFETEVP